MMIQVRVIRRVVARLTCAFAIFEICACGCQSNSVVQEPQAVYVEMQGGRRLLMAPLDSDAVWTAPVVRIGMTLDQMYAELNGRVRCPLIDHVTQTTSGKIMLFRLEGYDCNALWKRMYVTVVNDVVDAVTEMN